MIRIPECCTSAIRVQGSSLRRPPSSRRCGSLILAISDIPSSQRAFSSSSVRTSSSSSTPYPTPIPTPSTLQTLSSYHRGTLYELHSLQSLCSFFPGLSLSRVGRAGDQGVDLVGWWDLSQLQGSHLSNQQRRARGEKVRVVVQCKTSTTKKAGPVILREVEGVMARLRRSGGAIAITKPPSADDADADGTIDGDPSMTDVNISADGGRTDSDGPTAPQQLIAIICHTSGFSKQTTVQTVKQLEEGIILFHLPLPDDLLLGSSGVSGTADKAADEPQETLDVDAKGEGPSSAAAAASSSSSSSSAATLPTLPPDYQGARPSSVLLSSSLLSPRGAFKGRMSIGTRRRPLPLPTIPFGVTSSAEQEKGKGRATGNHGNIFSPTSTPTTTRTDATTTRRDASPPASTSSSSSSSSSYSEEDDDQRRRPPPPPSKTTIILTSSTGTSAEAGIGEQVPILLWTGREVPFGVRR